MNDRPSGMHDIGRNIIMGGSSGQTTAIVTTSTNISSSNSSSSATTTTNGVLGNEVLENNTPTNGVHHHHPPTSTTANDNSIPVAVVNSNNNNNHSSIIVKQLTATPSVIKCNSSSSSSAVTGIGQSHVPRVTMSDGQGRSEQPQQQPVGINPEPVVIVSSSSSEASSTSCSRSSSLSISPNPMMLIRGDGDDVEDARKVEPLKINLHHREPIRTVIKLGQSSEVVANNHHLPSSPKITIKPIPSPVVVTSTNDVAAVQNEDETIPKLHIRMNHHHQHPHVTEENSHQEAIKLTIRNAATTSATVDSTPSGGEVENNPIPKLTIKVPQGQGHQPTTLPPPPPPQQLQQQQHPPVPKLTIKMGSDHHQPSTNVTSISSGGLLSPPGSTVISTTTSSPNSSSNSSLANHHPHHPQEQSMINDSTAAVPKLKVKLSRPTSTAAEVPSEEDDEEEEDSSDSGEQQEQQLSSPRVPKLTIKPIVASPQTPPKTTTTNHLQVVVNSNNNNDHQQQQHPGGGGDGVPRLVIKPVMPKEAVDSSSVLPLDVSTAITGGCNNSTVGPQSPRIILKINKNQNSIVSNTSGGDSGGSPAEENPLKRQQPASENVAVSNSTPKRPKVPAEERIIAVIDLDEENSSTSKASSAGGGVVGGEQDAATAEEEEEAATTTAVTAAPVAVVKEVNEMKNGRPPRRQVATAAAAKVAQGGGDDQVTSKKNAKSSHPQQQQKEDNSGKSSEEMDVVDEAAVRLQATSVETGGDEQLQTPVVKRGRGRPRKTPVVSRDIDESSSSSAAVVSETAKKRSRKKREDQGSASQVPATESANASEDEALPSPAAFASVTKRPRGGGRGGGGAAGRTPAGRGGGSAARRGRGAAAGSIRKPFNKQQYFKQKNFEDSIMNTYFEEDNTRMSAADSSSAALSTPKVASSSNIVNPNDPQDSVSQSSILSSTMDSTQTGSLPARKKLKMEVVGTLEGKTEFTVDMLAEYEWPPNATVGGGHRDTYMIQEQIAEYLGVKSFKRKYPDLERRTVEMEERDYLIERGLATEKLCDLGVTAVYAVDVLDIMHQDFHDKYEQYKKYHREKMAKDLTMRQKLHKAELGLGARDKAMRSVSKWNATLNKTRLEDRRTHMDLQNFNIHVPEAKRKNMTYPTQKPSLYPVSVVVGQFSEYYKTYSPLELACFPINTALTNPEEVMKRLLEEKMRKQQQQMQRKEKAAVGVSEGEAAAKEGTSGGVVVVGDGDESVKSSSDSSSSDESEDSDDDVESVDTSSSESDCDVHDDDVCCVCAKSQFTSPNNIPELFVKCAICLKMAHPSCIEMSSEMAQRAFQYQWQCVDCKRCQNCQKPDNQQKMIYCHQCDRAYHIYCTKSLQAIPKGMWHCDICSICRKCGCRNPDGTNNKSSFVSRVHPMGSPTSHQQRRPDWKHEYVKNEATGLKEHCGMLCVRCVASMQSSS